PHSPNSTLHPYTTLFRSEKRSLESPWVLLFRASSARPENQDVPSEQNPQAPGLNILLRLRSCTGKSCSTVPPLTRSLLVFADQSAFERWSTPFSPLPPAQTTRRKSTTQSTLHYFP